MRSLKIGQNYSGQVAQTNTTDSDPKRVIKVTVKDSNGQTIHDAVDLDVLRCFSSLAKEQLISHPAVKVDEKVTFTVPGHDKVPHAKAGVAVLAWMSANRNIMHSDGKPLSMIRYTEKLNANQLIQMAAFAMSVGLLPRDSRHDLVNNAVDAIVGQAVAGTLKAGMITLAIGLFAPDSVVVHMLMKGLAFVGITGIADEDHVWEVMREAEKENKEVKNLFAKGLGDAQSEQRDLQKVRDRRARADKARQDGAKAAAGNAQGGEAEAE